MSRILIVDDEPFNIDSIKVILQCALAHFKGFDFKGRVDSAFNGQEAIDTFIQNSQEGKNYELILMDCNMPLMDGYTATQEIRAIV